MHPDDAELYSPGRLRGKALTTRRRAQVRARAALRERNAIGGWGDVAQFDMQVFDALGDGDVDVCVAAIADDGDRARIDVQLDSEARGGPAALSQLGRRAADSCKDG